MQQAAGELAAHLKAKGWFEAKGSSGIKAAPAEQRTSLGDLVEKLDIGDGGFEAESVEATPVEGATRDTGSPIVLLGDSFTNIYSAATLDWGEGAGFAEHLALGLGQPLDVIAINGGAATEVREVLAKRKGSAGLMKEKKIVVWAIAARDLFLSETAAREAEVEWEDVQFNNAEPSSGGGGSGRVLATLVSKPDLPADPQTTAYSSLLYAAEYHIDAVLEGDIEPEDQGRIAVLHWAFRDRQWLDSSAHRRGAQREFEVVPFDSLSEDQRKELQSLETRNDSDLFDLYWDTSEPQPIAAAAGSTPHLVASTGCAVFALLLGLGLRRANRRSDHDARPVAEGDQH